MLPTAFCKTQKNKIVAETNHCCLPANYKRGFEWQPIPKIHQVSMDPDSTLVFAHTDVLNSIFQYNENQMI